MTYVALSEFWLGVGLKSSEQIQNILFVGIVHVTTGPQKRLLQEGLYFLWFWFILFEKEKRVHRKSITLWGGTGRSVAGQNREYGCSL